jgi:broad specificity phosphatase PhoE
MDLILIRHGQSQYNYDQTGGIDAPLTQLGRWQAARAGLYLKTKFPLRALYASTYSRARETAEIINQFVRVDTFELMSDLREFSDDYSEQMQLFHEPRTAFVIREAIRPEAISPYYTHFQGRVQRAMEHILSSHGDGLIGIVSHGGVMGTIIRTLAGSHHFSLHTENTGIHILHWEHRRWHIVALNRVEHLECQQWDVPGEAEKDA